MQRTGQKDFQVAIVGGGVCGLTCAIALQRAGVPVQLFEAAVCPPSSLSLMHALTSIPLHYRQPLARSAPE